MKNKLIMAIMLSLFAITAHAGGMTGPRFVSQVTLGSGGKLIIIPVADFGNPDFCQSASAASVASGHPQLKAFQAAALTATVSEKKVNLFVDGCEKAPWGDTIPVIQQFRLLN